MTTVVNACRDTRASQPLAAALQGALALGNFLNWGGRLGAAPGFRLKNLPKLQVCGLTNVDKL